MVGKLFHLHQWKAQGKISAMRGFRLGDHTFPFLFKLVVDVLSWLMYTGVGGGGGKGFYCGGGWSSVVALSVFCANWRGFT